MLLSLLSFLFNLGFGTFSFGYFLGCMFVSSVLEYEYKLYNLVRIDFKYVLKSDVLFVYIFYLFRIRW